MKTPILKVFITYSLLLFLFQFSVFNSQAQEITGELIDFKTKESLPNVTLRIFDTNAVYHSGYATDQYGTFSLEIPLDTFIINFSFVGYASHSIKIEKNSKQNIQLGQIALEEDSQLLNEVSVTANSVMTTIGKTIVYPTQAQLISSDGGLSLLKNLNLEGLLVDPINETIKTNLASSVIYKIDGVPSSLQQIKALRPEAISRIEYNSIATARYASDDAAVIDVILKQAQSGTTVGVDFTGAPTTGFINGMASIISTYGKSKFFLDYNISWRSYTKPWGSIDTEYRYPTDTLRQYKEYDDAPFHYTHQNIDFGYVYNGKKDVFSANMILQVLTSRNEYNYDIYNNQMQFIDVYRYSRGKDNQFTPSIDLFYKHKIKENKGMEFNLVGTVMNSDLEGESTDTYIRENDRKEYVYRDTDGRKKSLIFEALYYDKKDDFGFSTGVRGMYSHTKNRYIYDEVARLKQMDAYPYAEIEGKIRNVNYTVSSGLKILYLDDFAKSKEYFRNLSTLSVFYKKNNTWNLRYNFRYSPRYPELGSMNNIDQVEDSIMIVRGNPNLKPSQTLYNRIQLTFTKKKLTAYTSVFAQKTFDAIQTDIFYDENIHSMVRHSDNHPYSSNYGANLQLNLNSLLDIFSIQVGGSWIEYKTKMNGERYSFNQWRWFINASAQIKQISINAGYNSPNKSMYGQTIYLNENYSQLAVMYKKGNLSLRAGIMYPFTSGTKYASERLSKVAPERTVRYIRDNRNMITLGFRYTLDWGKSIFNTDKKLQNSDFDRGILN